MYFSQRPDRGQGEERAGTARGPLLLPGPNPAPGHVRPQLRLLPLHQQHHPHLSGHPPAVQGIARVACSISTVSTFTEYLSQFSLPIAASCILVHVYIISNSCHAANAHC